MKVKKCFHAPLLVAFGLLMLVSLRCDDLDAILNWLNDTDTAPTTPSQVEINPIQYIEKSFLITWGQNPDSNFRSYTLYESSYPDMRDAKLIFETTTQTDTLYVAEGIEYTTILYYRITISNYWGLTSDSDVRIGTALSEAILLFLPFNQDANDKSGHEFQGIVQGASLTSDRFDQPEAAFHFDGIDDYIQIVPLIDDLTKVSWCLWVRPSTTGDHTILSNWGGNGGSGWQIFLRNSRVYLEMPDNIFYISDETVPLDKWTFIAVTADGQTLRIYINGEMDREMYQSQPIDNSGSSLRVGDLFHPVMWLYAGDIDDVMIYDDALTQNEIEQLYHLNDWK